MENVKGRKIDPDLIHSKLVHKYTVERYYVVSRVLLSLATKNWPNFCTKRKSCPTLSNNFVSVVAFNETEKNVNGGLVSVLK